MKTLVIHPDDRSTDFLCDIYEGRGYTVLRKCNQNLLEVIPEFDRVIMLGHGSPSGLFAMGKFQGLYAIQNRHAEVLKDKENIYIWCHANQFVEYNKLKGFASGMFISEVAEAAYFGISTTQDAINKSNEQFAKLVGKHVEDPHIYDLTWSGYRADCPVVTYNRARLISA